MVLNWRLIERLTVLSIVGWWYRVGREVLGGLGAVIVVIEVGVVLSQRGVGLVVFHLVIRYLWFGVAGVFLARSSVLGSNCPVLNGGVGAM